MALVITLTPNVANWVVGDSPISVNISGGNATTGPDYYWESNSGTFDTKFSATANFTPNNATKIVQIIGRRVKRITDGANINVSAYGIYGGVQKNAGSTSAWDAYSLYGTALPESIGFIEAEILEVTTEKAMGFLSNSTYRDPNITNADANMTFSLCWHFYANGTAVARKAGQAMCAPVVYRTGDLPRVTIEANRVVFSINGIAYATTTVPTFAPKYGLMSFKTLGAVLNNPNLFFDYANNEGSKTLSVTGLFPVQPNYTYELTSDNVTLVSLAEDGSATFRKKGNQKRVLGLQFTERPYSEWVAINNFWKAHEKHEKFVYQDLVFNEMYIMRFDAGLRTNVIGPDNVTISITLKEV